MPDPAQASFERGVQFWLIAEARKRNPTLPLLCLSWGMPYWVGNGTTLSAGGAKYHVDFLLGAKREHGIDFDYVGIWNEAPWSAEYIKMLRAQLDAAGLGSVGIVAADGSSDVIKAAAKDVAVLLVLQSFGRLVVITLVDALRLTIGHRLTTGHRIAAAVGSGVVACAVLMGVAGALP